MIKIEYSKNKRRFSFLGIMNSFQGIFFHAKTPISFYEKCNDNFHR